MTRVFAVLGSALFFALAPGTVAGLVPWWISRWRFMKNQLCGLPLDQNTRASVVVCLDGFHGSVPGQVITTTRSGVESGQRIDSHAIHSIPL